MRAENKLVYLLKFYLPHHGFPDLWIISPPFHHEAWVYHLAHVEANIDYMLSLLRIYVPLSTTVVFMADARECPDKRPPQVLVEFLKAWNVSRNERFHQMNQVWYSAIADYLDSTSNWNSFLDATKITCPLGCNWHQDGAHLVPLWYERMSEYVLGTFCSG